MSEDNEFSVFISPEQKRALIMSIFSACYHPQVEKEIILQTILPPDLLERFDSFSVWIEATNSSRASVIVAKAKETVKNEPLAPL